MDNASSFKDMSASFFKLLHEIIDYINNFNAIK